jgi:ABC-type multidrug transport system fused ATPase/permease subunit
MAIFPRKPRRPAAASAVVLPSPAPIEGDDESRYKPIEWSLVRRLLAQLKPYRRTYTIAIVLGLIHVLLDMLTPTIVKWIVNLCTAYEGGQLALARSEAVWRLVGIIAFWALVFVGSVVLQRLCIIYMTRAGESVQFDLRRKMFGHLQTLSMSYYDRTKLGRIISRLTSDINSLREVNVWGIWQVVANGMIMFVAASFLLATDWRTWRCSTACRRRTP